MVWFAELARGDRRGLGQHEGVMERAQVLADRGQFTGGGTRGIGGRGRCAVTRQTTSQEFARLSGVESVSVDEEFGGIAGEISPGGELNDRHAREGQVLQGPFGALQEETVSVTNADYAREGVNAAELGGTHEDFELPGTFADCVAG